MRLKVVVVGMAATPRSLVYAFSDDAGCQDAVASCRFEAGAKDVLRGGTGPRATWARALLVKILFSTYTL